MFHSKTIQFLVFCAVTLGTTGIETGENSDNSGGNPSDVPEQIDDDRSAIREYKSIEMIRGRSTDDSNDSSDIDRSDISNFISNERTLIPEHEKLIDDETSESSEEEWFCVDARKYKRFQRKLNRFFSRGYSRGYHLYYRGHRNCHCGFQSYPRGYRCELIKYLVYQNIAGLLFKVDGIFGMKNSTKVEEKKMLVYQNMRRKIQWTWP